MLQRPRVRIAQAWPIALAVLSLIFVHCTQRRPVEPTPNVLVVNKDSLSYTLISEGPAAPAQMIEVSNEIGTPMVFQVTHRALWVDLFYHGTTPDTIFVFASSRDYVQGIYYDTIKVSSSGAEGSPHEVSITMTNLRGIKTIPPSLHLTSLIGGPPFSQETLIVAPTGGGTMFYQITNPLSWLTLSRLQGVARDTLLMSFHATSLARGSYVQNFTVTASQAANSPLAVPCSLSVVSWGTLFTNASYGLRGIRFLSPAVGVAVGFKRTVLGVDGYVFRTTDSGATWAPRMLAHGAALVGLKFLDGQTGFAYGEKGDLLETRDGGLSWGFVLSGGAETIVDFVAPAPDTFYSVGDQGSIRYSFDNGLSWHSKPLPVSLPMSSLQFLDGHRGWTVGGVGTILYTGDAGDTWQQAPAVTSSDLRQILLLDSSNGYIVGDGGVILSRIDGNKWVQQQPGLAVDLRRIFFADRQTGWIVGESGTVLHTTDGGQNWLPQASDTKFGLFDIWFLTSRHGWIAGDNGLIKTTYSGGEDQ